MVMTRKYIDDMFHSLRTHVCLTWILAMVMHIVTGNIGDNIKVDFGTIWGHLQFWEQFGDILGAITITSMICSSP